jgi:hypothetical protein
MTIKIFPSLFLLIATSFLYACGASTDEYKKFSKAGQLYAIALEKLLVKSAEISINKTSEDLIKQDPSVNITAATYARLSEKDKATLKASRRIITQTRLLKSYFIKLEELASSDLPDSANTSTKSIVDNISKLSGSINKERGFTSFIPSTVKISISSGIRQALKNELSLRGLTILEALQIQEELILTLRNTINLDMQSIVESRELRFVVPQITSTNPVKDPDEWIKLRQAILTSDNTINELSEASQSLTEFKNVFRAILEDKLTNARIESFLKEADDFIKIVEKNKVKENEKVE